MTDEETIAKGRRAFNELSEVNAVLDAIQAGALKLLLETSPEQTDKILRLHTTAQTMVAVRHALQGVVDNGRIAEHAISQAGLTRQTY